MSLRPRNIIQAAEADLKRRARNKARSEGFEHYAFYAPHVRRARDIPHLLTLALKHGAPNTTKKNTLLIYGDAVLLTAARYLADYEAFKSTEQPRE